MKSSPNLVPSKNVLAARPLAHHAWHLVQRVFKIFKRNLVSDISSRCRADQWHSIQKRVIAVAYKANTTLERRCSIDTEEAVIKGLKAPIWAKCKRKKRPRELPQTLTDQALYVPRDFSRLSDVWLLCFRSLGKGSLSSTFLADAAVAKLLINLWLISWKFRICPDG